MSPEHKYYADFTEEEFAADEYFQHWVLVPDEEIRRFWETYLIQYPEQQTAVNNASRLVQHLVRTGFHVPFLSPDEKVSLKNAIFEHIEVSYETQVIKSFPNSNRKWWLLAASILVLLLGFRFFSVSSDTTPQSAELSETTQIKQIRQILLPDSSIVILNGNSTLKYNSDFATSSVREVYLDGNAYFQVRRTSSNAPFIVHARQLKIYVTGTEFNVNAHTNASDVVLTKGKINVTLDKDKAKDNRKTVYLESGYSLHVDTLNNELQTAKTNTELYTSAWKLGEWHFEDTSLETIARLIREYYGIETVFTSSHQRKLMITAVVSVKDLSTLIQVIEKTLNLNIQTQNQHLIIINPQSKQL